MHQKLRSAVFLLPYIEIKMDPLLVDVNVHPTKQEVRLSKEKELTEPISNAIQKSIVPRKPDSKCRGIIYGSRKKSTGSV